MNGLQFKIELAESDPLIWRRIVVPVNYTFYQFHLAIQAAFGWENYHMFQFCETDVFDNLRYAEPDPEMDEELQVQTKDAKGFGIMSLFPRKSRYVYIYDYGDHWQHTIQYEKTFNEDIARPFCLEGSGACPPEDCGGIDGYKEMVKILNTPHHREKKEYAEWLGLAPGEKWNAAWFSYRETKKRMCLLE